MQWKEGNLLTGEKTTVRTGLPSATWRKLNYGVQPSKSVTAQVTDACGMLEAYAEVDKALADLNGNTADFRLSEDRAFLEAMNQQLAATLFYGDTDTNPERFNGFRERYKVTTAASGGNIISGGGNGSVNTSVWLITWDPLTTYGIYPKGSKGGWSHQDLGEVTLFDSATPAGRFQGYRTHYKWDCGLTVRDWRYNVRIANVDVTTLTKNAGSGADLIDLMTQALELPPSSIGKRVFYCNRTIKSFLRRQIQNKTVYNLTEETVAGKPVMMFGGVPVRRCDQILSAEATVV
jgi:hypothetical protein